jgi:riboflavin synthase
MGDPLGGHVVTGHVDALGTVLENTAQDDGFWRLRIHFEDNFGAYVFKKGSVSVSGVSLTVANCNHQECWLEIMLIPHTLQQTNLTDFSIGSRIELEFDSQAKMVAEMLENMLAHLLKTRSSKN